MDILNNIITIIYHIFIGFITILLIYNWIKTKEFSKEIMYLIVIIPFLLRLFWLK